MSKEDGCAVQPRLVTGVGVRVPDDVSNRVVEPEKHVILGVGYYRVRGNRRLVELVKKTLQSLMGIIAHRVLKPIVRHLCIKKRLFHDNGIYHLWKITGSLIPLRCTLPCRS